MWFYIGVLILGYRVVDSDVFTDLLALYIWSVGRYMYFKKNGARIRIWKFGINITIRYS